MSKTAKKEGTGRFMAFLVITILILVGASIGVKFVFSKEEIVHNPCDVPDTIISTPHANSTDLTQNNGYWDVRLVSLNCHKPKVIDIEFRISEQNGLPIWSSKNLANAPIEQTTSNYYWKVFPNGDVHFERMHQRYPLVPDRYLFFDMVAAKTTENATVIMYLAFDISVPQYLSPGDTLFVFRDTNADGKDDISEGCRFELIVGGSMMASTILS